MVVALFREEQEKLNIFVALMNLENLYGTQESLVKVFDSALQQNEPKKVFFHLINIYDKSNKMEVRILPPTVSLPRVQGRDLVLRHYSGCWYLLHSSERTGSVEKQRGRPVALYSGTNRSCSV